MFFFSTANLAPLRRPQMQSIGMDWVHDTVNGKQWSAPPMPDFGAGAHALLVASGEFPVVDEVPDGGQLARQGVLRGDLLLAVDSRPVKGLSLKVVKAMIEGPLDSVVLFRMERPSGERYEVRVVRTFALAEDIQIATFSELLQLLEQPTESYTRQSESAGEGAQALKAMHDALCSRIVALKKSDQDYRQDEELVSDLRQSVAALSADKTRLSAKLEAAHRTAEDAAQQHALEFSASEAQRRVLEADLARSLADLEESCLHKDQRAKDQRDKVLQLQNEVQRLSREVEAQAEARKVQLESANVQRNLEETRLRASVDEHRKQAHEHEAAARAMAHELERRQTELAQSSAQVKRLEEQLEKLGAREAQLQADAIARSQQMRHSLDASEQAQGDAHATIATLRLELADMQRHKERADAADAKVREQASEIMDLQLQMRGQADLARVQTDDEKASLQRQYENERREFVSHLENAEGSIQTLRSELENGQKAHAELMSKVFAQESLQASLSSQLIDANSQAAQARSAQDLARCEIESLQKQRQEDLAMMEALNADLRQLRVEENSWKRIERNKIIAQLESLEHENQSLKARLAEVSARNAGLESHLLQARQLGSKQDGLLHHAEPTTNEVAVQEGSVASTSDKGRGGGLLGMGWF